jgi:hypothetical protein
MNIWKDSTDDDVVSGATQGGPSGQGAVCEMTRRFMVATKESSAALATLTRTLIFLTRVIVVLAFVQAGFAVGLLFRH